MPAKSKAEHRSKCHDSCCAEEPKSFVFLTNEDSVGSGDVDLVKLKHPATNQASYFAFPSGQSKVYEILTFSDPYRSWLVGEERVESRGCVYLSTPVHPVFLALPYLTASVRCSPLDQILRDPDYPDVERLLDCSSLHQSIASVAEVRGSGDVKGYLYDEEKTLSWLVKKVERGVEALHKTRISIHRSNTVASNNFIKHSAIESSGVPQQNKGDYLRYSFGLVSEYLSQELSSKLEKVLKLEASSEDRAEKRELTSPRDSVKPMKKQKTSYDDDAPTLLPTTNSQAKAPTPSAKEKARKKAAAGSRSISSFFQKST